jgi:type VII secretion ATPase EccA
LQLQSDGCNTRITGEEDDEEDSPEPVSVRKQSAHSSRTKTELDGLIGLESVKREVEALTNYIRIQKTREEKGLMASPISYHCVFTGNPGTGKTTVARILAKIYKNLGVVSKGHLVETDRSGLVAEYVGQTAVKTNKIIDSALDGILFIDEAYSLIAGAENDYGKEAIATLLKRMEDDRNRLVVILAGYTKEMKDFIDSNPGLQSRFNRYIEFPDYNADELYQIFCKQIKKFQYTMSDEAAEALKSYLAYEVAHKDQNFGNGRFVRNLFERTLQQQANRLSREVNLTTEKLSEITKEDIPIAL